MGTSNPYGGASDRTPLLPSWAVGSDPEGDSPLAATGSEAGQPEVVPVQGPALAGPTAPVPPSAARPSHNWSRAKRSLGAAVGSRNRGGHLRRAGRRYVRALGGSSAAARSSRAGRRSTAALAGFLVDVSRNGFNSAVRELGLGKFVGQDKETVVAALVNALAPDGASREEAVARRALSDAMRELCEKHAAEAMDLSRFQKLSPKDLTGVVMTAVSSYIYRRWLADLGLKIEQKSVSAREAVKLEREVKRFVRDAVRINVKGLDPLKVDWRGQEGKKIISVIYREAFGFIGGES